MVSFLTGKSSFVQASGDPDDDKLNSQLCVKLTSFSRYSVAGGIPRVTAPYETPAESSTVVIDNGQTGVIFFTSASPRTVIYFVSLLFPVLVAIGVTFSLAF